MKRFIQDSKKYWHYAVYAAKANLKSEIANSYLNWIWWILEPICFMFIYTLIFGVVFKTSEPYFNIFIFIGLTLWEFFNRCVVQSVKLVKNNKPIVSKVYLPKFILIYVRLLVNGFKMLVSMVIVVIMMIIYQVPISWYLLYLPIIMVILFIFTFAVCTFLMHFGVFVDDLSNVINIGMRALFYLTGIFYDIEKRLGDPYGRLLNTWNPLANLISNTRDCLLYASEPSLKSLLIILVASLLLAALGVRLIYKNENSYVKVV